VCVYVHVCVRENKDCVCVCVCVCVRERERERECVCVRMCMDVCVRMGGKRRTRNVRGTGEEGARRSGAKDLERQQRTAVPIGALLPLI